MAPCRSSPTPPKSYAVPPPPPPKGPLSLESLEDPLELEQSLPLEDPPLDLLLCCHLQALSPLTNPVRNADPLHLDHRKTIWKET